MKLVGIEPLARGKNFLCRIATKALARRRYVGIIRALCVERDTGVVTLFKNQDQAIEVGACRGGLGSIRIGLFTFSAMFRLRANVI